MFHCQFRLYFGLQVSRRVDCVLCSSTDFDDFSGLAVSMLFGYFFLEKRYTPGQIVRLLNGRWFHSNNCLKTSVFSVSVGVIFTTLSRPNGPSNESSEDYQYLIGICMLTISSLLTGVLGMLQELTYRTYGPCWREGVFYTVSSRLCAATVSFITVMAAFPIITNIFIPSSRY
jgi:hypothetical protein